MVVVGKGAVARLAALQRCRQPAIGAKGLRRAAAGAPEIVAPQQVSHLPGLLTQHPGTQRGLGKLVGIVAAAFRGPRLLTGNRRRRHQAAASDGGRCDVAQQRRRRVQERYNGHSEHGRPPGRVGRRGSNHRKSLGAAGGGRHSAR